MNELPNFPNFRPFNVADIDWYNSFYIKNGLNPYADAHFGNLLTWLDINNDLNISVIRDDAVVFKYTNPLNSNEINLLPLAHNLTNDDIEKITNYIKGCGSLASIQEIPSTICRNLDKDRWRIEEFRDSYEYVYSVKEQSELIGPEFSNHRRVRSHFERTYLKDDIIISLSDCSNEDSSKLIINFIEHNKLNHSEEAEVNNKYESNVIKKSQKLSSYLHKKLMTIKINGRVVAIVIISFLDQKTISLNHIKVDYSIRDIFNYTFYRLAKLLDEMDIDEINLEQDLGIDGMRIHKEKLRPSRMLEKKIIRPRL